MRENHPHETLSPWMPGVDFPIFPLLRENIEADVCVIGGGIAGITTAYLLMKEGKKVCVLEDSEIGSGQTGRTTAHFTNALDDRYFVLEKLHGTEGARLAAESHTAAIARVEEIVRKENIDCDLARLDGYLFDKTGNDLTLLEKELGAAQRAGLTNVHFVKRAPLDSVDTGPSLRFPNQLQLHPLKYLYGLTRLLVEGGAQIFTRTHVMEVHGGKGAHVKTTAGFTVHAESIVVATNVPINNTFAIHTKQAAYRTYVIGALVPQGTVAQALFWDTSDPYHYVRIQKHDARNDLLIVGGEDHKTGQNDEPDKCFRRLESWAREKFPFVKDVAYSWSGQVMEPVDSLAFLGRNPGNKDNVFIITGDSGNGMTHTTIGAMLITDLIFGRPNPWEDLYSPSRVRLKAAKDFFKENMNVALHYGDWFKGSEDGALEDLRPGEGTVVPHGLKKAAVYKNEDGQIEMMSAKCPHLGCVVAWNGVEKSWDCPCHGSRFDCHGKVMEGPAIHSLEPLEMDNEGAQPERESPPAPRLGPLSFSAP